MPRLWLFCFVFRWFAGSARLNPTFHGRLLGAIARTTPASANAPAAHRSLCNIYTGRNVCIPQVEEEEEEKQQPETLKSYIQTSVLYFIIFYLFIYIFFSFFIRFFL